VEINDMANILDQTKVDLTDIFARFFNERLDKWQRVYHQTVAIGSDQVAYFRDIPILKGSLSIQEVKVGRINNIESYQVGMFDECNFMLDPNSGIEHYTPLTYAADQLAMIDFNPIKVQNGYHEAHYFQVEPSGVVKLCKAKMEVFHLVD
jgi:hypothetical protein